MRGFLDQNRLKGDFTHCNDPQHTNTSSYELVSVYRHNGLLKNKANGHDLNFSVQFSSLRFYADDTTAYASNTDISAFELSLNKDLEISHPGLLRIICPSAAKKPKL